MKFSKYAYFAIFLLGFLLFSCSKEEVDTRMLVPDPIFPDEQPNELNDALIIQGQMVEGNMPNPLNPDMVNITISIPSALISNDNFLFLPFAYDLDNELAGIYLQVEGAENHWNAPITQDPNNTSSTFAIAIGIPGFIQAGSFIVRYAIYDLAGNISEWRSIVVSIITAQESCANGNIPRIEGEDGITVKTFDMGNLPGVVEIRYFMYTQKDRMDIRYNNEWVASTSPTLLSNGAAPPIELCDLATEDNGFVSGFGSFEIPYDPAISREVSIYVSGCLQGGTLWYFDVECPQSSGPTPSGICGNPTAQEFYDMSHENYHLYPKEGECLSTIICNPATDLNCTLSKVFNAMKTQANFIAPTNDVKAVEDCKKTWVSVVTGLNPIISKVNQSAYSITNYTLANETDPFGNKQTHLLHPGKVTRKIEMKDGNIVVSTTGEGTGLGPWLNEYFSENVWGKVDKRLKKYWDEQ